MSTIIFNGNLTGSNFGLVFADAGETPGINVSSNPTFQVSVSINGGQAVEYTGTSQVNVSNSFDGDAVISVTGGWKNSATSEAVLSLPKQAVTRYADNYFLNSSKTIDLSTDSKDLVFKFSGDHVGLRSSDTIKLVKGTNYTLTGHDSVGFTFDGLKTGASFSSGTLSAGSTTGKAKYTYSDGTQTRSGSVQIVDALDSSAPSDLSSLLTQRHVVDASAYNGGYFNKFCTSITVGNGFALHGVGDFADYESLEQLNNASGTTLTFSGELDHAFLGCKALSTSTVLSNLDLSNVTKLVGFMSGCKNYTQYKSIEIKAATTDLTGAFEFSNYNARMKWYTQNVVSMESLFEGTPFNQGKIRSLNTAKVVSFKNMFKNAKNFNQGLKRGFSTGSATTLEGMFQGAESFNKNVSAKPGSSDGWDVSKVTNFKNVFKSSGFKKRLTGWDTSSATDMSGMLADTDFNGKLDHLNTSNVVDMTGIFEGSKFNRPIKTWDVTALERAERMFAGAPNFNKSINDWNIGKVSTFEGMFEGAGAFDRGLNSWGNKFGLGQADNPAVNFKGMFEGSKFNQNVKDWDMSHATSVENMFKDNTTFNKPLFDATKLNSDKLESLDGLLDGATGFATAVAAPDATTELKNSINNFGSGLENIDGFGTFLGSIASDIPDDIKSEQLKTSESSSQGSSGGSSEGSTGGTSVSTYYDQNDWGITVGTPSLVSGFGSTGDPSGIQLAFSLSASGELPDGWSSPYDETYVAYFIVDGAAYGSDNEVPVSTDSSVFAHSSFGNYHSMVFSQDGFSNGPGGTYPEDGYDVTHNNDYKTIEEFDNFFNGKTPEVIFVFSALTDISTYEEPVVGLIRTGIDLSAVGG